MKTAVELYNEISVQQSEHFESEDSLIDMSALLMCELILSVRELTDKLDDIERVLNRKL